MPAWLIPVLKSVLPHVGTIIAAATPVFTKKSADAAANQAALLQQQITELQAAASANDAHIKKLAMQLQSTVEALEKETALSENRHRLLLTLSISAILVSLAALGTALYLLFAR
jgi:hypothetical protein